MQRDIIAELSRLVYAESSLCLLFTKYI